MRVGAARSAAVAGQWYPGDGEALRKAVQEHLDGAVESATLDIRASSRPTRD